jgi:hypothetical protein
MVGCCHFSRRSPCDRSTYCFDLLGFGDASNLLGFLAGVTIIAFSGLLTARLERFRRTRRMTTGDTSPETVDV